MDPGTSRPMLIGLILVLSASSLPGAQERAAAPSTPQSQPATQESRPRSLFLYLEDGLGAAEVPAYGYPQMTTPNLVLLMEEGVTYLSENSVSPWTIPATASLLTSLYPSAHGAQKAGDRLPASARTLAEVLKENGYETALFSSHPLIGSLSGMAQGFDRVEEVPGPFYPAPSRGPAETSAALNRQILAWLDKRSSRSPTFIVAVSSDPLEPYGVPDPEGSRFIEAKELAWYREIRGKLLGMRPGPLSLGTAEDLKQLKVDASRFARAARLVYDGAIYHNDWQIRSLKNELGSRGLWNNTLFVFTSTHGEEFLEHGLFGHGSSLYDSTLRVPVVLTGPGLILRANQIRKMIDSVDLMPTLLGLLQIPIPDGVQGIQRSVLANETEPARSGRPAFAEAQPAGDLPTGVMSMVAEEEVKLVVYDKIPAGSGRREVELFRWIRAAEDWEKRNWAASAPEILSAEREVLDDWRQGKGTLQLAPDPEPATARGPRLKEVLHSLGYLQGIEPLKIPARPKKEAAPGTASRPPS